jgi:hypothetical protein
MAAPANQHHIFTAILIAGALTSSLYIDQNLPGDREIRQLADFLYRRINWKIGKPHGKLWPVLWPEGY